MPKNPRKSKTGSRSKEMMANSDDDSVNDNASVSSYTSDIRSVLETGGDDIDEQSQIDNFEEQFSNALDQLLEKSVQTRVLALESISKSLSRKYIPDFINDRKVTMTDAIERCLKKGRGEERSSAAELVALLCIQLGTGEESEFLIKALAPTLSAIAFDKTTLPQTRSKCCFTLGLSSFLCHTEIGDILSVMRGLERVFAGSYLKGDGSVPLITAEMAHLQASALSAWALLLTILPPGDIYMFLSSDNSFMPQLDHLTQLLESSHLEVRMAAGEAIALAYELGRIHDIAFQEDFAIELCDKLRHLAKDSHKYRAKKDRKQQRSSFRDILHLVEDGCPPNIQLRFGHEMLPLDSWSRKRQYDAFCQILGSGMNLHLTENDLLRDVFELGDKIPPLNTSDIKQSKLERHLTHALNFKTRTKSRNKNRDKRNAINY